MKNKFLLTFLITGVLLLFSCKQEKSDKLTSENVNYNDVFIDSPGNAASDIGIKYTKISLQNDTKIDMLTTPSISSCGTNLPTKIEDLISGVKYFYYKFDFSTKAEAAAMGFSGSFDKKDIVIIRDFVRYKKMKCEGKNTYFGIGLRCFIHIKSYKGKLGGSVSAIAASVELGRAEATFSIESIGFPIEGKDIAGVVTQGDYNVENFAGLAILHSRVLSTLNSDSVMKIDPVELPVEKGKMDVK